MTRPDRAGPRREGGGRVRADREGPLLHGRLHREPPGLVLVPPKDLVQHDATQIRAWFSDAFLAPLNPAPQHGELAAWFARSGLQMGPLAITAMVRERCGGRRYCFHIPGRAGARVWSERAFRATFRNVDRVLLPAIPRRLRPGLCAPPGHRYLSVDIDRCFPTLLAIVARDEVLLGDIRDGDLHQRAGDAMAAHLPLHQRRQLGKLFNNAVVGLIGERGWHRELRARGLRLTAAQAASMHAGWWGRYHQARRLRDAWTTLHHEAAERGVPLAITYPDGRIYRFDVATLRDDARGAPRGRGSAPERIEAAVRRSFSAIWRGVEGAVLDCALARLYGLRERGLRLVLPLYDGLLLQVPSGADERWLRLVRGVVRQALDEVGIPATVSATIGPAWGSTFEPDTPEIRT